MPDVRYQLAEHVVAQTIEEETVLLHAQRGLYFELNPTGSLILRLLEQGLESLRIAEVLQARFDVSIDQALIDCQTLIEQLRDNALLSPIDVDV